MVATALFAEVHAQDAHHSNNINQRLIFEDNFTQPVDTSVWRIELENAAGSWVKAGHHKLELNTGAGVTVWLKKKLSGKVVITYDRKVVMNGGSFDRLSDLNQFFMAAESQGEGLAVRKGQLDEYNSLKLYYVGMGGNANTTTRFRRYDGSGSRILLAEYTDMPHLLIANKTYHIKIEIKDGEVSYRVDGALYFSYQDKDPLKEGYFGFRSTKSHQEISKLKIYSVR
jgi:rhamnogalacturonan endolyase